MVKKTGANFQCPACGLRYADKGLAEKCEAFCTEHNACSLEIIKHALKE